MAHLLEQMAYVGTTPWHELGHQLPPKQPIEVWAQKAGMDWTICETAVRYLAQPEGEESSAAPSDALMAFTDQKVLYRSDTRAPLSVVGGRYKVVQPRAVLEFYRDLTEVSGFELETAGVLKAGKKFWALARSGKESVLKGNDVVRGYILLATSCDGTLATTATPTTVRVVCNNTLSIALNGAIGAVRVPHSTVFDAEAVKKQLGIAVSGWDSFMYRMKHLSERKVKSRESMNYLVKVLSPAHDGAQVSSAAKARQADIQGMANERALKKVLEMFEGKGRGAELGAAKGTAWGLLCAVTEYVDHERRARNQEYRLDSAWFGKGAAVKQRALDAALQLVS